MTKCLWWSNELVVLRDGFLKKEKEEEEEEEQEKGPCLLDTELVWLRAVAFMGALGTDNAAV